MFAGSPTWNPAVVCDVNKVTDMASAVPNLNEDISFFLNYASVPANYRDVLCYRRGTHPGCD